MAKKGRRSVPTYILNTSYTKRLIKNKKLNRDMLSKRVPASTQSIHRWLSGKNKISGEKLILLARVLEVDPCALIEGDDQRAYNHLRDLLNRAMEEHKRTGDDVPLIDVPTFISIMKALGYDKRSDVKVSFNRDDYDIPSSEAEDQINSILDDPDSVDYDDEEDDG